MSALDSTDVKSMATDTLSVENSADADNFDIIIRNHQDQYYKLDIETSEKLTEDIDEAGPKSVDNAKESASRPVKPSNVEQSSSSSKRSYSTHTPDTATADIESVRSQTSKRSKIGPSEGESRVSYLTRMFTLLRGAVNAGNEEQIEAIINESCLPDCVFKTPALSTEVRGRDLIFRAYVSMLRLHPDIIMMETAPPAIDHRVITTATTLMGTRVGNDAGNEFLYNFATHGVDPRMKFAEVRTAVLALIDAGKPISFRMKTYVHLVLNAEMTHVAKWLVVYRYVTVSEAKNI